MNWARAISLVLLLIWTLLAGQCVVCPEMQATKASPHDCCNPTNKDHCGTPAPDKQCNSHDSAFEASAKIQPVSLDAAWAPLAEIAFESDSSGRTIFLPAHVTQHPPPDPLLLTSILLI